MTVTYSAEVADSRLTGFSNLLLRWKGSIYKLLYKELLIFIFLFTTMSAVYRLALTPSQRETFELISVYMNRFTNLIPMSFVLGFYVTLVVTRWWNMYVNIPWPDRVATLVAATLHGSDDSGRLMRRSIVRYMNLSALLVFCCVCKSVKKRFPTEEHIIEAGFMTPEEHKLYHNAPTPHPKYWMPANWAVNILAKARKGGRIQDDMTLKLIYDEINIFKGNCGMLFSYDWISIPLVYTQVVTLAVYSYFAVCILGRQYLDTSKEIEGHDVDLYVPFFTILQFVFYFGWLKVAESLINPFGEDDDDFEMNWVIDRNFQVGFLIADEMYGLHPPLTKDMYWDEVEPQLPYTTAAVQHYLTKPFMGSTADISLPMSQMGFTELPTNNELPPISEEQNLTLNLRNISEQLSSPSSLTMKYSSNNGNLNYASPPMSPAIAKRSPTEVPVSNHNYGYTPDRYPQHLNPDLRSETGSRWNSRSYLSNTSRVNSKLDLWSVIDLQSTMSLANNNDKQKTNDLILNIDEGLWSGSENSVVSNHSHRSDGGSSVTLHAVSAADVHGVAKPSSTESEESGNDEPDENINLLPHSGDEMNAPGPTDV